MSYGARPVLTGIDLLAQPGRRIGLDGEDGVGKSALLRAVADVERLAGALDDEESAAAYDRALEWALAHDAWDAVRRSSRDLHDSSTPKSGLGWQDRSDKGEAMYPLKVASVLGLLAGWLWLAHGYVFAEYDQVAIGELEAGGRFGFNFSIVLPYLGLSGWVALAVVLSLRSRTALPLLLALVAALAFTFWVLSADEYAAAFPDLEPRAIQAMLILMASLAPASVAVLGGHHVDESVAEQAR